MSATQAAAVDLAEAMAGRGATDANREIAGIAPDAGLSRLPDVDVDRLAIASLVKGMGDRIVLLPHGKKPSEHAAGQLYQAVRILETEGFKAYNQGRLAVELAVLANGPGETFALPTTRDVKDYVVGIVVRWDARLDRRTCKVCAGLEGALRPLGMTFDGGPMPPGHARCRCCGQFWPVAVPKDK